MLTKIFSSRRVIVFTLQVIAIIAILLGSGKNVWASIPADDSNYFIFEVNSNNVGETASDSFRIPTTSSNYQLYWEEVGNESANNSNVALHVGSPNYVIDFGTPGIYRVAIDNASVPSGSNDFNNFATNNAGDAKKITKLERWGSTQWVTLSHFFSGAENLTELGMDFPLGDQISDMSYMFSDTPNLTDFGSLNSFRVANVTNLEALFMNSPHISVHDVDLWDVRGVENFSHVFDGVPELAGSLSSDWITTSATNMAYMFRNVDLSFFSFYMYTANVVSMEGMFEGAVLPGKSSSTAGLFYSSFDVSSVMNMSRMFSGTSRDANATTYGDGLSLNSWNTTSVEDMSDMFSNNTMPITVPSWDVSSVTDFSGMFAYTTNANPDLSSWNIGSALSLADMFRGTSVANPSVASWDVSSVIDFSNMFKNAAVAQPDVSSWNTANGIDMSGMFSGSFASVSGGYPNIKAWNVSSVQDMSSMLDGIRLPTMEYDELLNNFNAQSLHSSVVFDAGFSEYCKANNSHTWLSSDSNGRLAWTIHDGGNNCYDYYLTEILEDSSSPGGANNANGSRITAAELADITGIVYYVFPEFESDYQNVIAAKDDFSNPPTIEEIQSVLSEVSAKNIVLWHSSSSGRNSAVQFIPLNNEIIRNIPGVTDVEPNNEDFYLRLITVESAFSDLPNTEHVQAIVDKANSWANAVREVLEDSQSAGGASNSNGNEVSFSEISAIVGLNGLASNNISHYRQAFSVHSGFSNPPSVGQIQTIVNSVNAKVEALEDSNSINGASNANGIYLSVGQLASIAGLTGISYSNAQYYNTAISAQSNFDNLPTTSQLQGVIDTANATARADLSPSDASQIALLEILEDSASAGGAFNTNGVKVSILQISAVQGITNLVFSNEQAYRAAISNKSDFGNLPTLLEVQNLINSVNVSQESMAAVLEDSPSPGGASNADSVDVQFSQLSNIVGLQNIDQNSIDYYVQLIRKKTDFSNLPTVAEIQNIMDEGNRIANSVAAILEDSASPGGAENTDGLLVNSEDLAGISLLDNILPQYDTYYRQGIAALVIHCLCAHEMI